MADCSRPVSMHLPLRSWCWFWDFWQRTAKLFEHQNPGNW